MADVQVDVRERLFEAMQEKRWDEFDELWLQVTEGERLPLQLHEQIIARLLRKKQSLKLADIYSVLFDAKLKDGQAEWVYELIQLVLALEPTSDFVRPHLLKALESIHAPRGAERVEEYLIESGLTTNAPDIRKCLSRFEELVGATKGQVFRHRSWGLGVVRELDVATNSVVIDFELSPNKKLTLEGVRQFLERVPKDHIHARMAADRNTLKAEAKEDPAALMRAVLKYSLDKRVKVADLKRLLTTRFWTEDEYKKWWPTAREALKLDPYIDLVGAGSNATLVLRTTPRSFVDTVIDILAKPKSTAALRAAIKDISMHGEDAELSEEDRQRVFDLFAKSGAATPDAERLARGLLFEEFPDVFGERENPFPIDPLLGAMPLGDALDAAQLPELRRVALDHYIRLNPETWAADTAEAFAHLDSRSAAWVAAEMKKKGYETERRHSVETVLGRPDENPELLLWVVRNIFEGVLDVGGDLTRPVLLAEELLSLLDEYYDISTSDSAPAERVAEAKNIVQRIRAFLQEGHAKHMKRVVNSSTPEEARKLLIRAQLHSGLAGPFKENIERMVFSVHPELRRASKSEEEEERKKPSFHYTLQPSLDAKRQHLSHIMSCEIPACAEAIAAARALGDLKENAEYHAAKERQKMFMQTASELEDLIARARIIDLDRVQANVSRFGTRLRLRRPESGEEVDYTLLGMWEADARQNIISYMTPLGSQLMNRAAGDRFTVVLPDGRKEDYEVLKVEALR
ncbi:MAG: GreA/GreB family elongation factor [Candidatus Sumerlaeia bacterium]|nr:GreA/GreB family elongation factor [Candidatus Sumerlaeia bacterium]